MKISDIFQNTMQKTDAIINDVGQQMGWEDRPNQSLGALRAVLQTLRDRLPVEEVADFGAQLPIMLRGIFYEGWKPANAPIKMDKNEFINLVRKRFVFNIEGSITRMVETVLSVLHKHLGDGEINDIESVLPKDLKTLFEK